MPSFSALSSVITFVALVCTSFSDGRAQADFPKSQQTMEVVGFSANGKVFAVKTKDDEGRHAYQVRTSKKGEIEKVYSFFEGEEKKTWRRVKRAHEITAEPTESPENEKLGMTLVTAQKGDKLVVFVMKGEKVKRYGAVSLQKGRDGKSVATANVGQLVWGPKGKHVVMIYHQKFKKPQPWESDAVHSFKFKRYKVSFDE
jgi:hypothetical protein